MSSILRLLSLPKLARYWFSLTRSIMSLDSELDFVSSRSDTTLNHRDRLATFKNDWPHKFLSDKQMVAAGFYFLCRKIDGRVCDDVKCEYCGIEVGMWTEGDDPLQDHVKYSPNCWFIRRMKNEGYDIPPSDPRKSVFKLDRVVSSLKKLWINKNSQLAFPRYADLNSRLNTFVDWPISLAVKPDALSEAGLFYTGKGDQTVCFSCGGELRHWENADEPWTVHARRFSHCSYIDVVKGQEFIRQARMIDVKKSPRKAITLKDLNIVMRSHGDVKSMANPGASASSSSGATISVISVVQDSTPPSSQDGRLCKICYLNEMGVVFLPCGHVVACVECASKVANCVVCKQRLQATMRLFLS